jgi:uncharacterized protein (DUF952 family)
MAPDAGIKTGVVYKLLTQMEWCAAEAAGVTSTPLDTADGYVHLSAAHQVRETARKYFAGKGRVRLLGFESGSVENLRWEAARNGELFPHVYGPLMIFTAHVSVWLEPDQAGVPIVPEGIG